MAVRELIKLIPPKLVAQASITSPNKSLSTVRIYGSNDATYGMIGWTPPTDGSAFAVLLPTAVENSTPETNRVWAKYTLNIFLAVANSDTPYVLENYNDEAMAWADTMMAVVAQNRRLLPESTTVDPTIGDVQWIYESAAIREQHPIYNIPFYGINFKTCLSVVYAVNYE